MVDRGVEIESGYSVAYARFIVQVSASGRGIRFVTQNHTVQKRVIMYHSIVK
jgi:hypothetical protein